MEQRCRVERMVHTVACNNQIQAGDGVREESVERQNADGFVQDERPQTRTVKVIQDINVRLRGGVTTEWEAQSERMKHGEGYV